MSTPDTKRIKAKLLKLLELSRQGVGGEKNNAQSVLDKLLKKHDLTLDDLDPEYATVIDCEFRFGNPLERKLLLQVISTVLQVNRILVRHDHKNSKIVCIEATRAQKLEIDLAWDIYRRAFLKEQDILFAAFIHKNNLYGPDVLNMPEEDNPPHKISKEDLAAIAMMICAIKVTPVHKALTVKP